MKKSLLLLAGMFFLLLNIQSQTVTDIDGNVYNTVTIGTQKWMASNLKTTRYRNGVIIPGSLDNFSWQTTLNGARTFYNNDSVVNGSVYGSLYNWYAVSDPNNLCPAGWSVPTDADWMVLINYCGGLNAAGGILKETQTLHWNSPNTGATNQYNFSALPAGLRHVTGPFQYLGDYGWWWSTTESSSTFAWVVRMSYNDGAVLHLTGEKTGGFSVRCVQNAGSGIGDGKTENELKIFPNPASDRITFDNTDHHYQNMEVFNSLGECLLQTKLSTGINHIDVNTLPAGMYILQFSGSGLKNQVPFLKN
jgi:uncharacterized protein (TIGR02145 family)